MDAKGRPDLLRRDVFPVTAAYIASLPEGLDSYAECTCRADVPKLVRDKHPKVYDGTGMTDAGRRLLLAAWPDDSWIPDATNIAIRLMIRDRFCKTDAEYLQWTFEGATEVFRRPVYRVLMHLMSPTLALMGVRKRWAAFRRGTTLTTTGRRNDGTAEIVVQYPPELYPPLIAKAMAMSFKAAFLAAKAKDLAVGLTRYTAQESRYHVAWR